MAELASEHPVWSTLMNLGFEQLLVHGVTRPGRPDEIESFFLFAQPRTHYSDDAVAALDMLLPCVHLTYQRVRDRAPDGARAHHDHAPGSEHTVSAHHAHHGA